ncbi:hypothetical protein F5883DRAFT_587240 [Diaporthe sp. PMI_573]|nr:hypothetical protein F5883DRAFT_587240 [Diaporthaceae sp. PMI_573]
MVGIKPWRDQKKRNKFFFFFFFFVWRLRSALRESNCPISRPIDKLKHIYILEVFRIILTDSNSYSTLNSLNCVPLTYRKSAGLLPVLIRSCSSADLNQWAKA